MGSKEIIWCGSSLKDVRDFPEEARRIAGYQLRRVQHGEDPTDWRPMASVGSGVREIRIHTGGAFRVMYVAKFEEAVYVLHAFQKKTQRTSKQDIDMAQLRYREVLDRRR